MSFRGVQIRGEDCAVIEIFSFKPISEILNKGVFFFVEPRRNTTHRFISELKGVLYACAVQSPQHIFKQFEPSLDGLDKPPADAKFAE